MSPTLGTRFADSIDVDRILCLPHLLASLQFQNTLPRPISCPLTQPDFMHQWLVRAQQGARTVYPMALVS
jgi:hypothetical protein